MNASASLVKEVYARFPGCFISRHTLTESTQRCLVEALNILPKPKSIHCQIKGNTLQHEGFYIDINECMS